MAKHSNMERLILYFIIAGLLSINTFMIVQNMHQATYIKNHLIYKMRKIGDDKRKMAEEAAAKAAAEEAAETGEEQPEEPEPEDT